MKAKYSLFLLAISVFVVGCFDSPEFSNTPRIKFEGIYFGKARGDFKPDSLVITLSFEDGDGDLGLDKNYLDEPFHEQDYFLANGTALSDAGLRTIYSDLPRFLSVPTGVNGKIATKRTSQTPPYNQPTLLNGDPNPVFMTPYLSDSACIYYRIDSLLVNSVDESVIDDNSDTYEITHPTLPSIFVVKDTFYVRRNPNFNNIEVEFFRKNAQDKFVKVDWYKELCTEIFEGRFPVVTDKENPLSGTIKYSMKSSQLENVMGNSIWQLRIRIRDRALNTSEPVKSREFTLQEILR